METKIKTFSLNQDSGSALVATSLDDILEVLRIELKETELDDDDDIVEFIVRIEKTHTQEELNKMSEWDGF